MCPSERSLPFVRIGKDAGRPACFADGSTVDRGAPKGIRNLTCGSQGGSTRPYMCRIVAGQIPFPESHRSVQSPPASGGFRASPAHKARQWHAGASQHFRTVQARRSSTVSVQGAGEAGQLHSRAFLLRATLPKDGRVMCPKVPSVCPNGVRMRPTLGLQHELL